MSAAQPAARPGSRPELWPSLTALAIAAFYLATSISIAGRRLFWFDELVTVLISRLPGASRIVHALAQTDNNMPAPYFLVVHWFFQLFGVSQVAARLPSALAMTAGLLIVYDCARRLTSGLHGLIAMAVLACSCLPYYGFEARSYGIYFMLAAFCFWIWVHGQSKYLSPVLFGAAFLASILVHYYAVLGLLPYAVWEARDWRPWRMPSAKLFAGGIAALAAAAMLVPQMSGAKRYSAIFWSPPTPVRLKAAFGELFPDALLLLAVVIIWIAVASVARKGAPAFPMLPAERLGWLGLLIPFAGYALARAVTNAYVSRYFIGLLPGVAVACACLCWRRLSNWPAAAGVLLILAVFGLEAQYVTTRHPEFVDPFNQQSSTRQVLQGEGSLRAQGKRYTLLTNGMLFLECWYYAKDRDQYALLVPSPQYLETHNTPRYVAGLARNYPMHFWTLDDLRRHAAETALVDPTPDVWALFKEAGIPVHAHAGAPIEVDFFE